MYYLLHSMETVQLPHPPLCPMVQFCYYTPLCSAAPMAPFGFMEKLSTSCIITFHGDCSAASPTSLPNGAVLLLYSSVFSCSNGTVWVYGEAKYIMYYYIPWRLFSCLTHLSAQWCSFATILLCVQLPQWYRLGLWRS